MKVNHLAYIIALMLFSCNKAEVAKEEGSFNDPNWIKLSIPYNTATHALYGSIEDTLLVSTVSNIYQITEKGKKITKINKAFNQPVFAFVKSKDTLFALTANHLKDNNGLKIASYAQNYSLDKGLTWKWTDLYTNKVDFKKEYNEVKIDNNLSFNLKENIEPFPNSTVGNGIVLKSDLIINNGGLSTVFKLPFNNQLTSLHLDKYGRLYISASCSLHNALTKKFSSVEKESQAVIYISKIEAKRLTNY